MRHNRRRSTTRMFRVEEVEPRLLMSGDPVADFVLSYPIDDQFEEVQGSLTDAHALTGLDSVVANYGFTGAGQTVAVIDSGIAYNHTALGGGFGTGYRVVGGFDFTEEQDADPYDDGPSGSHGTHVAGIIGSDNGTNTGVASGVDLVSLRVFNDAGEGYFGWVENALQWVHDNRNAFENPITAVNLSLGTVLNADTVPSWAVLENEFAQLEADGIFISVAAGNSFTEFNTPGLNYPAVSEYVVAVSSVDDDGSLSYFSQRAQRAIAAPGRGVLSTVPDYVGNGNGVDDDFARYSGTSMAAPYIAGASVLLREAYEFAGVSNVVQDDIYNLMMTTADTIFDPITGLNYCRLNLQNAIDAIMPADDIGSTVETAYGLGTVTNDRSIDGTIGKLDDSDWFTFTAGGSGIATFSIDVTHEMAADWDVTGASNVAVNQSGELSFDVVAGEEYSIQLGTKGGLGHYTVEASMETGSGEVDWGTVAQQAFAGNQITRDGQWFVFTAANDGIMTVQASFANANGDVDIELYNADRQRLAGSDGTGDSERVDVNVGAGDRIYLRAYVSDVGTNEQVDFRVTNLVANNGDVVEVLGTSGDDAFAFVAGSIHRIAINGVDYEFSGASVHTVEFDGQGGADTATLTGTSGDDQVELRVGTANMSGVGYAVTVGSVETITVDGAGGYDKAAMYDSVGDDKFVSTSYYAKLYGTGYYLRANRFEEVNAFSTAGGTDEAYLYDSTGDDVLTATPDYANLSGNGFDVRVNSFDMVRITADGGGNDLARLYGSSGSDTLVATPTSSKMYGNGFYVRARLFDTVYAYSGSGGNDRAFLYDSAGDDTFVATSKYGKMYGEGFYVRANDFDSVMGYSAGGVDSAHLYDSAGDDTFKATPDFARMSGQNFLLQANSFDRVYSYATLGGNDTAQLYDSTGDDTYVARVGGFARLSGAGYWIRAKFFETVHSNATRGGNDAAVLLDSVSDDRFSGERIDGVLSDSNNAIWAHGFDQLQVVADQGGNDSTELTALDYVLQLIGEWD